MAKKFQELRSKMPPDRQKRSQEYLDKLREDFTIKLRTSSLEDRHSASNGELRRFESYLVYMNELGDIIDKVRRALDELLPSKGKVSINDLQVRANLDSWTLAFVGLAEIADETSYRIHAGSDIFCPVTGDYLTYCDLIPVNSKGVPVTMWPVEVECDCGRTHDNRSYQVSLLAVRE